MNKQDNITKDGLAAGGRNSKRTAGLNTKYDKFLAAIDDNTLESDFTTFYDDVVHGEKYEIEQKFTFLNGLYQQCFAHGTKIEFNEVKAELEQKNKKEMLAIKRNEDELRFARKHYIASLNTEQTKQLVDQLQEHLS